MRSVIRGRGSSCDAFIRGAVAGDPELIQIVTWNDWEECAAVEPDRDQGFADLDAIERWWCGVIGLPVDLADNRAPLRELYEAASSYQRAELPPDPSVCDVKP